MLLKPWLYVGLCQGIMKIVWSFPVYINWDVCKLIDKNTQHVLGCPQLLTLQSTILAVCPTPTVLCFQSCFPSTPPASSSVLYASAFVYVAFVWLVTVAETRAVLPGGDTLIKGLRVMCSSRPTFLSWIVLSESGRVPGHLNEEEQR